MASQIDPTKPVDGTPAIKADLRANLASAKSEIEALQNDKAEAGHVHALNESLVSASRNLTIADSANRILRVYSMSEVTLTVPPASSVAFPPGTTITIVRWGPGALNVAAGAGVTLHKPADRGNEARTQYSVLGLWQQTPDVWLLYGDLGVIPPAVVVSEGGGTLVYEWTSYASLVDDGTYGEPGENVLPLSQRNANDVHTVQPWIDGQTAGAVTPIEIQGDTIGGQMSYCWNRAPTGEPALEVYSGVGMLTAMAFLLRLYAPFQGTPRHLRVVMELKTCKASDPTTYKGQGLGTTSGSYTNWSVSHAPAGPDNQEIGGKYFLGQGGGQRPSGGGSVCWWGESAYPPERAGYRVNWHATAKNFSCYTYNFDRGGRYGGGSDSDVTINQSGVHGVWHRLEQEIRLTTPGTVPENARRAEPEIEPDHTGDGYHRIYVTKDIDGELGPPGARQQVTEKTGLIFFPKYDDEGPWDDLHLAEPPGANLLGIWFQLVYGGASGSQAEAWAWIRKVQVYRHD